jgi:serine/threonine protein kinase
LISSIEYCHENAKIIHRDIKPENILIDEKDVAKLTDFGVSLMMQDDGSDTVHTSGGSYYYNSPEACLGATYKGKKSDIWACGVTLYFMFYKQHPFEAMHIPDLFKKIAS